MSVEVELNVSDYHNLMNWYELAFAKQSPKDIKNKDHATFRKLSVMAEAYVQIQKDMKDNDKEEV
jgi:hypothetical protein